ncbi:hypothetical protein C8R45DRAFT_1090644 [Mycena sanguinolenta]|nr:hypothetical protein C8R45DRAFT_1090644 [Mycena sanguinolenta]
MVPLSPRRLRCPLPLTVHPPLISLWGSLSSAAAILSVSPNPVCLTLDDVEATIRLLVDDNPVRGAVTRLFPLSALHLGWLPAYPSFLDNTPATKLRFRNSTSCIELAISNTTFLESKDELVLASTSHGLCHPLLGRV